MNVAQSSSRLTRRAPGEQLADLGRWHVTLTARPSLVLAAVLGAALVSACNSPAQETDAVAGAAQAAAVDQDRLNNAASDHANWMTHGGTYAEQRFSPLDQINGNNIGELELAWYWKSDSNRGHEATPIVVDGVMYISSAWSKVHAFDAATGKQLWSYDPENIGAKGAHACCDVVNRGVAVWKGKVFVGTIDGRLIALDAQTGKPLWSVVTVDQSKPYTITGAPRVFKDKVIIGNSGAELGVRGYVTAYDTETGRQVWRFYTVPGNPSDAPDGAASDDALQKIALPTWHGEWWKYGGGGTVWDSIVYDPELDQLYIGVGNGSPWNHKVRSAGKGDNLFLSSIVALDPDTGRYRWHYQANPGETWDFTSTQQITLATLDLGQGPRKVLMQAPKNGFFYVIDRTTGKLLSARNFVPVNWAHGIDMKSGRPIERTGARYEKGPFFGLPSGIGAHAWQPMSYNPKTGLVYIPAMEVPLTYSNDEQFRVRPGRWNTAVSFLEAPAMPGLPADAEARRKAIAAMTKGHLLAWDPVRQKEVWRVQYDLAWNGGTLTTAGNLVFQGNARGAFQAFRADNGRKLWSFQAPSGVMAGPITYKVGNDQYVAVLSGYGGSMGMARPLDIRHVMPVGMLMVFKLNGGRTLPPFEATPLPPPNPSAERFSPQQVSAGMANYLQFCAICHRGSVNPDLRRSAALTDANAWRAIVLDGAMENTGMASFRDYLTPADAEAVRAAVSKLAQQLQDAEKAGEQGRAKAAKSGTHQTEPQQAAVAKSGSQSRR